MNRHFLLMEKYFQHRRRQLIASPVPVVEGRSTFKRAQI